PVRNLAAQMAVIGRVYPGPKDRCFPCPAWRIVAAGRRPISLTSSTPDRMGRERIGAGPDPGHRRPSELVAGTYAAALRISEDCEVLGVGQHRGSGKFPLRTAD